MTTNAAYWVWGTHGRVEVDDTGNIQVAVRAHQATTDDEPVGIRTGRDGFARADVSNVAALQDLLTKARAFAAAVFPPGPQGDFTWEERAQAYRELDLYGKMLVTAEHAKIVSEFLTDWRNHEKALGRAAIPEEREDFARSWERWW